jgi:hypothetical protein
VVALLLDAVPNCFVNRLRVVIREMRVRQNQIPPWLSDRNCRSRLSLGFWCPRDDSVFLGPLFVRVRFAAMVSDEVAGRFERRE